MVMTKKVYKFKDWDSMWPNKSALAREIGCDRQKVHDAKNRQHVLVITEGAQYIFVPEMYYKAII